MGSTSHYEQTAKCIWNGKFLIEMGISELPAAGDVWQNNCNVCNRFAEAAYLTIRTTLNIYLKLVGFKYWKALFFSLLCLIKIGWCVYPCHECLRWVISGPCRSLQRGRGIWKCLSSLGSCILKTFLNKCEDFEEGSGAEENSPDIFPLISSDWEEQEALRLGHWPRTPTWIELVFCVIFPHFQLR